MSKKFDPMSVEVVLYHSNCPDGIGAAWPIWKIHRGRIFTKGVRHGEPYPDCVKGKNVAIVDFSYNRATMKKLCSEAKFVTVIDHHKTAIRDLDGLENEVDNYRGFFAMERSGAQMVWDLVHNNVGRPWFVEIIADRDLWKWEIPNSKYIGSALYHRDWYTFNHMDNMFSMSPKWVIPPSLEKELIREGKMIEIREKKDIDYAVGTAILCKFQGHKVRLTTCHPALRSEVGNILSNRNCDFAAIWRYDFTSDEWWVSLRAGDASELDLSKICEKFGGGGHPKACGFTIHGAKSKEYRNVLNGTSIKTNAAFGPAGLHSYFQQMTV